MTLHHRSLTIGGAIFAIILSCFTGNVFAQSADQSADQESPSAETATPIIPINWADFSTFDTGYESSVAIHPSGLIVEVHSSGQTIFTYTGLYYRIGKLDPAKETVSWGPAVDGYQPAERSCSRRHHERGLCHPYVFQCVHQKQCCTAVLGRHAGSQWRNGPAY